MEQLTIIAGATPAQQEAAAMHFEIVEGGKGGGRGGGGGGPPDSARKCAPGTPGPSRVSGLSPVWSGFQGEK